MRKLLSVLAVFLFAACEREAPEVAATKPIAAPQYPAATPRPVFVKPTPTPSPVSKGWIDIQADRWQRAIIRPEKQHFVAAIAQQIKRGQGRYESVSDTTNVPWTVIASIHNMECGLSFNQNLANGDPLTARTRHVPAGRPLSGKAPFSWEDCAVDALRFDKLDLENWRDVGNTLANVEAYNGVGYKKYHPDVPSPYLWSWTNLARPGKYVADGKWSPTAMSEQCGVVPILKQLGYEE